MIEDLSHQEALSTSFKNLHWVSGSLWQAKSFKHIQIKQQNFFNSNTGANSV